ncbi:MAG: NADH:flavin oxidoreductase [Bacteroidales bacterium]
MTRTLLESSKLSSIEMKNRFFRGALWEDLADEKGHLTPELSAIYEELAVGGAATLITGYAFVTEHEQPNPGMMGIYEDSFIPEYREFTNKIHSLGANIIMQICYGGSMTTYNVGKRTIWGPSSHVNESTGTSAQEITKEEIKYLVGRFAQAARRVKESGFDGVEIHAGHGYLFSQFLSPCFNKREDEYGGDIHNRARIIYETYQAMRDAVGDDFPILIKLNSADFKEGGLTEDESFEVAKRLSEMRIDAIEVTGGNESLRDVVNSNLGAARRKVDKAVENQSYFRSHAARLAQELTTPIILIGGNRDYERMEELLNSTNISFFSMSRPLTAEPNLINIWASGNHKKPKCISCNKCYFTPGKRCILNIKGK